MHCQEDVTLLASSMQASFSSILLLNNASMQLQPMCSSVLDWSNAAISLWDPRCLSCHRLPPSGCSGQLITPCILACQILTVPFLPCFSVCLWFSAPKHSGVLFPATISGLLCYKTIIGIGNENHSQTWGGGAWNHLFPRYNLLLPAKGKQH